MSDAFPKHMTVKQAVLATLAYFELFGVPLTRDELSEHLFFSEADEEKIDIYLRESPLIRLKDGYYSIEGSASFYEKFFDKMRQSLKYWKKVRRWHWLFSLCPFIQLVSVVNALPLYAVEENSDIDLFIVSKKNRLFLTRFFLTLLTTLFRIRRHGNWVRERFCLSFYISEENLNLGSLALEPYDIYLAYWLKTLQPIAGNYEIYQKLMKTNALWLGKYFKRWEYQKRYFRKVLPWQEEWKHRLETWLNRDSWESKVKRFQLKRAKEKYLLLSDTSGTLISRTMLKFHDRDERTEFRKRWVERLNGLLS